MKNKIYNEWALQMMYWLTITSATIGLISVKSVSLSLNDYASGNI